MSKSPPHSPVGRKFAGSMLVILAIAAALATAGPVHADAPVFTNAVNFASGSDRAQAMAVGDVDGDGDLDLALGSRNGQVAVYLNDGSGNFGGRLALGAGKQAVKAVALADLNGDGYRDVVTGGEGQNYVYLNQLSQTTQPNRPASAGALFDEGRPFGSASDKTLALAVGDVTGDGAFDIVAGNDGQDYLYPGDGAGNFRLAVPLGGASGRSSSVALLDLDQQNGLDVVVANGDEARVYYNQSGGLFLPAGVPVPWQQAQSAPHGGLIDRPLDLLCKRFGQCGEETTVSRMTADQQAAAYVAGADVDGDTALDLVVVTSGGQLLAFAGGRDTTLRRLVDLPAQAEDMDTRGMATGDVDGDGQADVMIANRLDQNAVYLGDGQARFRPPMFVGNSSDLTAAVALVDVDGNGHVDLVFANDGQPSVVYRNNGAGELVAGQSFGSGTERPSDVALVDVDGDGFLDLLMAQDSFSAKPVTLYSNRGTGRVPGDSLFLSGVALSDRNLPTKALAVGNLDQNPLPDVVLGNANRPSEIWFNLHDCGPESSCQFEPRPLDERQMPAGDVALGDLNGDDFPDVVLGVLRQRNKIYLNDGTGNFEAAREFGSEELSTQAVALGDVDADGDLDIVAGTSDTVTGQQDWVYINDGKANFDQGRPFGSGVDSTRGLGLGDFNGDGYLDIAAVRHGLDGRDAIYLNNGRGAFDGAGSERPLGSDLLDVRSIAVADYDGDGDLDIVTDAGVFLNDGRANFAARRTLPAIAAGPRRTRPFPEPVAVGDLDRDGDPDLVATSRSQAHQVHLNELRQASGLANQPAHLVISGPNRPTSQGESASDLRQGVIPVTFQVSDPDNRVTGPVRVCYSLDGGGRWQLALQPGQRLSAADRIVYPLTGCPYRVETAEAWRASSPPIDSDGVGVFEWDTAASGFFGQSNAVVLRVEAYPDARPANRGLAAASSHPYVAAETAPFAARGTQVQVLAANAGAAASPASGALVFQVPAGQPVGGKVMGSGSGAYRTDGQGYLQGRGRIDAGDTLVALWPITHTRTVTTAYSLFYSSASPISTTVEATAVPSGTLLHQLVVSPDNPLLLFDLNVSLEWDARNDPDFLVQLDEGFKRASEILYDLSNGQMALGRVRVFQNKEQWLTSDVQIYASNRVRPRASMGGVALQKLDERDRDGVIRKNAYMPGSVRMGPNWDPFGLSRAELGRDWWRALAHELGHYLLFLPDDYLGYKTDEKGQILDVTSVDCQGSVMTTAYDDAYSEFVDFSDPAYYRLGADGKFIVDWPGDCKHTLAAYTTKLSDWEMVQSKYPMVRTPGDAPNPGPAALPLELTQVQFVPPQNPTGVLPARFFDLRSVEDGSRLPVPQGQVVLFKSNGTPQITDDTVVSLGTTGRSDSVKVRGAAEGDRVCVFDNTGEAALIGCAEHLSALSSSIPVAAVSDWQPNIQVHPTVLPTLVISVTRPAASAAPIIEVRSLSGPISTTVKQVPELGLATVRAQSADGEGQAFTVVISGTDTITSTDPRLQAWLYRGPSLAITSSQPAAPGQAATVAIGQPGLEIAVAQPVSSTARLYTQVFPGYQIGAQAHAPTAAANPAPADGEDVFRAAVALNAPVYTGMVRTWLATPEGTPLPGREAVAQFYLKAQRTADGRYQWGDSAITLVPRWQDKLTLVRRLAQHRQSTVAAGAEPAPDADGLALVDPLGLSTDDRGLFGTDDRGLFGTDDRGLFGTDDRGLFGVDYWAALWTDDRGLLGTDDRGLFGTDDRGLLGTDDRGLFGTDDRGLLGTDDRGLLWTDDRGLHWTDDRGLLGTDDRGLLGTDDRALLGADDLALLGTDDRGLLGTDDRGLLGTDDRGLFGADVRGLYPTSRAPAAPISSADGGVTIFSRTDALIGDPGIESLEALPEPPGLPEWLTPVGQAYRFVASDEAPRTVEFAYYQREVPEGYEHALAIYYSPDEGATWTRLPTNLEPAQNHATAQADQSGLYVLTAAVEIPFYTRGWNLFSYPVPLSLPVQQALASIDRGPDCCYTTVYGFNVASPSDPWQVYDRRIAADQAWANDLETLQFGQGYWINVTEPITLVLKVGAATPSQGAPAAIPLAEPLSRRMPPAVYFGELTTEPDAAAEALPPVTAVVDGAAVCGEAVVEAAGEGVAHYLVKVDAADEGRLRDCGAPGKQVTLRLGETTIAENLAWDNTRQAPPVALPTVAIQPSTPPAGIEVGQSVAVSSQLVNLRRSPGYVSKDDRVDVVATVPAGSRGVVLDGPVTADGLRWWQVRFDFGVGWIAETSRNGLVLLQASR